MGTSSSAINPTQDFLARMGGGRLFDMGASTVKYGTCNYSVYAIGGAAMGDTLYLY